MQREPITGIDLGTTNSEVAIIENGSPRVLEENGTPILPSVVGLTPDGKLLVGEAARNQWLLAPDRTIRSVKRRMGEDVKLSLGDQQFSPQEISAIILRTLKDRAERHGGHPISKAVITVPAFFNDAQRQATREAGELAGLEVVRIIHEPTAASLVYEASQTVPQTVMVYDLGGGTFDVSIVRIEKDVVEVLASHGDTHLGGDDFDALLVAHVAQRFEQQHHLDLRHHARAHAVLWRSVEQAKIRLSTEPFTRIDEEFIIEKDGVPLHLSVELDRSTYEDMIRPLIERTMAAVQTALDDAKLKVKDIHRIVLAGGATRTPLISEELRRLTGREPSGEVDPDLCVAMGAAIQGGIIAGHDVGAVLVDVTPHTFGIGVLGFKRGLPYPDVFSPIIHKNTPLPATRSEIYSTHFDNQESVKIDVYQGEHEDALQNTRIGHFIVEGLSPVPAPNPVTCRLDLDLNGMLKVTAREKNTGLEKHIVIENAMSRFESEEMTAATARLRRLFGDIEPEAAADTSPTDPIAGDSVAARLREITERARNMLPDIPVDDRDEVIGLIERVHDGLAAGAGEAAHNAARELEDILYYLEEA